MKKLRKIWIPLITIVVIEVIFCLQMTAYTVSIWKKTDEDSGSLHAALLVDHIRQLTQQLNSDTTEYVRTAEPVHLQNHEKSVSTLDTMMAAHYRSSDGGWTGFRLDEHIEDDPSARLLNVAGSARFQPDETEAFIRLVHTIKHIAATERAAMNQVTNHGTGTDNLQFVGIGSGNEDYQNMITEADSQIDALQGMVFNGHYRVHHPNIDYTYWLVSLGLIQASLMLGAAWLGSTHLSRFEHHAFHDSLTGLPNRWYVELHLNWACSRAKSHGDMVILAFIDLNGFKPINDSLGHDKGDYVLKYIAENLRANCRSGDMAFRYGGDEFVVVFITPAKQARQSLDRLKKLISTTFSEPCQLGDGIGFGAAVGISIFPSFADTCETLVQTADKAMYEAKKRSKANDESLVIVEYSNDFPSEDKCKLLSIAAG